jgi:hypothetical protein
MFAVGHSDFNIDTKYNLAVTQNMQVTDSTTAERSARSMCHITGAKQPLHLMQN